MKEKWKRLIIVGAPGAGKDAIRLELLNFKYSQSEIKQAYHIHWFGSPAIKSLDDPAVGELADYRQELTIAVSRMQQAINQQYVIKNSHAIFTHTLLDSLAHATARLYRMVNSGSVSDLELLRWEQTLQTISLIFMDSFKVDPIIFLPGNDGKPFSVDVEEALRILLKDWQIPHLELTSPEDTAIMIRKVMLEDFDISKAIDAGTVTTNSSV